MFLKLIVCVDVGESRVLIHCWWECELVQPLWTSVWRLLRKLKDPAIALLSSLSIHVPKNSIQYRRDSFISMSIAALLTIERQLDQFRCSPQLWCV